MSSKKTRFEVPLYAEPSHLFKKFLVDIGNPLNKDCTVSYFQRKLTFSSRSLDENGRKASVSPVSHSFSKDMMESADKKASLFASKFNAAMSLLKKGDMSIRIQLITDISETHIQKYGEYTKAILQCAVTCRSLATEMALTNFFTVIDPPASK